MQLSSLLSAIVYQNDETDRVLWFTDFIGQFVSQLNHARKCWTIKFTKYHSFKSKLTVTVV